MLGSEKYIRLSHFHFSLALLSLKLLLQSWKQAVSHWLPTALAQVHIRADYWVCGGQSSTGAGFL
jgi:hypothetical protein